MGRRAGSRDGFHDACVAIKVLNNVRRPEVGGIPLSYAQYEALTAEVLIGRLVAAHRHLAALRIATDLRFPEVRGKGRREWDFWGYFGEFLGFFNGVFLGFLWGFSGFFGIFCGYFWRRLEGGVVIFLLVASFLGVLGAGEGVAALGGNQNEYLCGGGGRGGAGGAGEEGRGGSCHLASLRMDRCRSRSRGGEERNRDGSTLKTRSLESLTLSPVARPRVATCTTLTGGR